MATAPKIFILHGWTKDASKWQPVLDQLKSQGFAPTLLKIPGLTAPIKKPYTLDDYVAWLEQKLSQETKPILLCHSFGGRIAIRYDVKHPNRLYKLILIDSAGIRPSNITAILKRISFSAVAKIGKKITSHPKARQLLYQLVGESDYYKADPILAQTMKNVIAEDLSAELPYVTVNTCIIWGANDTQTPLQDGRLINKAVTGSQLHIIDSARHSPQFTHTDKVLPIIVSFLTPSH